MANPIIYGPAYSTFARTVRLGLEEKGVPYELQEVDLLSGAHQSAEHLARHPFGKVPAFSHDGFDLYETGAILRYINDTFDGVALQPSDARQRARMNQIVSIVDSYAYPCFITNIFIPRVVAPMTGGTTDEAAVEAEMPKAETCVRQLDKLVGNNKYAAGDTLSMADLALVPVYDYFSQTPEGQKSLQAAPNLQRWWSSISARPSVEKTKPSMG
ncbi:MAG: glutathione S-transferase family protein [Gammaproteobacteria bacterium]|nr:glutathione S-transferase family protein [Gammaproteobacteria bacterium]